MLIFSIAGIPLVVASVFSKMMGGVLLGTILLLIDLVLVPREKYESPWRMLLKASPGEKTLVIGSLILLLAVPLFAGISPILLKLFVLSEFLPGNRAYYLSLFLSYVLFALWFALRIALRL